MHVCTGGPLDRDGAGGGRQEEELGQQVEDDAVAAVALADGLEHDVDAVGEMLFRKRVQLDNTARCGAGDDGQGGGGRAYCALSTRKKTKTKTDLGQEGGDECGRMALGAVVGPEPAQGFFEDEGAGSRPVVGLDRRAAKDEPSDRHALADRELLVEQVRHLVGWGNAVGGAKHRGTEGWAKHGGTEGGAKEGQSREEGKCAHVRERFARPLPVLCVVALLPL